jgi:hypothetical protein
MRVAVLFVLLAVNVAGAEFDGAAAQSHVDHRQTRWPNGRVRSDAFFADGVLIGEYRTYYQSGAPYELRHYVNGREEGRQQSWTEDGELFLNYDVTHGRRYGLVNARPCIQVSRTEGHP